MLFSSIVKIDLLMNYYLDLRNVLLILLSVIVKYGCVLSLTIKILDSYHLTKEIMVEQVTP